MDLFDELAAKKGEKVGEKVREAGGDLFDELGMKKKAPEFLSDRFNNQAVSEERARLMQELNDELSGFDAFLVSAGRTMTNVGRMTGMVDSEPQGTKEAFKQLAEDRPISTTLGEVAPFAAAGAGAGAFSSLAARLAFSVPVGAVEGAVLAEDRGQDVAKGAAIGGSISGAFEIAMPVLSRVSRAVFSKITGKAPKGALLTPDGAPTKELQEALESTGTSFDSLMDDALAEVKPGTDPSQAVRAARFKSQGIPATTGDVTQDFAQQAKEARLTSMASGGEGEPLRQLKLDQSQAFEESVGKLVSGLGVADDTGDSIKAALTGRKKVLTKEKNKLYSEVFAANPDIKEAPIFTSSILEALPDADTLDDLSIASPESVEKVKLAMARFGVDTSEEAGELLEKRGIDSQPLTAGNFERFRKTLNSIERADQSGAAAVMTGPIKTALDGEGDLIADAIKASGADGGEFIDILSAARSKVVQIKKEFSPESITGKLIKTKRDGVTPTIEASKVANELLRPTAPIENLSRTIESLNKSGAKGKRAIGDLQASAIMRAMDDALKAPSRKTSGIQTIGGNQFAKSLEKMGDDKLNVLFANDKKALRQLKEFIQTAKDIEPTAGATVKGSAPVILDMVKRLSSSPLVAPFTDAVKFVIHAGADERAVREALKARPQFKRAITQLEKDFPALAGSLTISATAGEE